jgi:hypothetical protein
MISPDQWDRFFDAYSKKAVIKVGCAASGISRTAFYAMKNAAMAEGATPEHKEWLQRFTDADQDACDVVLETMHIRAIDGVEEPIVGRVGKDLDGVVCTVRKYSDALLVRLAQARMPEMFKDRTATELSGPNGKPIQTETKVIAVPAIEENAPE